MNTYSFKNIKELSLAISKAIDIDRSMPRVAPDGANCLLGKMAVIPDIERSLEDLKEDALRREMMQGGDYKLWWDCMHHWLPSLDTIHRQIVMKRCGGMGWKRLATYLREKDYSDRILSRMTLYRMNKDGLKLIFDTL